MDVGLGAVDVADVAETAGTTGVAFGDDEQLAVEIAIPIARTTDALLMANLPSLPVVPDETLGLHASIWARWRAPLDQPGDMAVVACGLRRGFFAGQPGRQNRQAGSQHRSGCLAATDTALDLHTLGMYLTADLAVRTQNL